MKSKMAAQLEADLAQSASYEQTGGVVNGANTLGDLAKFREK